MLDSYTQLPKMDSRFWKLDENRPKPRITKNLTVFLNPQVSTQGDDWDWYWYARYTRSQPSITKPLRFVFVCAIASVYFWMSDSRLHERQRDRVTSGSRTERKKERIISWSNCLLSRDIKVRCMHT